MGWAVSTLRELSIDPLKMGKEPENPGIYNLYRYIRSTYGGSEEKCMALANTNSVKPSIRIFKKPEKDVEHK